MPAEFLAVGAQLISWAATYVLHSTCLVGAVWMTLRFRPATGPAVRETLWKIAIVGGLITTPTLIFLNLSATIGGLTLTLPVGNEIASRPDTTLKHAAPVEIEFVPLNDESTDFYDARIVIDNKVTLEDIDLDLERVPLKADSLPAVQNEHRAAVRATVTNPTTPVAARSLEKTSLLVLLAIGAGFFSVGLFRHLRQTISLRRRLARAQEVCDGSARDLLDELCRSASRTPAVRLLAAPHFPEPAAFGLWRWTIVLPAQVEQHLSADELRSLLAHELAHLVRGDMWWLLVSRLVCLFGGFQPFNHLARREWQRAAEYLCDAWAVSRTADPLALARCLTEVASWRLAPFDCASSLGATGSRSTLADRIERLVEGRSIADPSSEIRTRRHLTGAAILVLSGLIGSGLRVNLSTAASTDHAKQSAMAAGLSGGHEQHAADAATAANMGVGIEGQPELTLNRAASDTVDASETQKLYEALDIELHALRHELAELQPLLKQSHVPKEAKRLAELLDRETTRLEEHRTKMNRSSLQPTGERRATAP
jgi:beta-lactamase regulating signal transducer with metallopeptidase domain